MPPKYSDRQLGLAALMLALGLMLYYVATMPPAVAFEDGGIFAGACATFGLPHPPGYPLYVWSCYPFAQLGKALGMNYAPAAALTSAVAATATCLMVLLLVAQLTGSVVAGMVAGGVLGLGTVFTSQAQIPEVYTLNAALTAALLLCTHRYVEGGSHRWLWGMGLITGMGLANHWPLFMLSGPASLLWLCPARDRLFAELKRPFVLVGCALALLIGLIPYVHLWMVSLDAYHFDDYYDKQNIAGYIRREVFDNDPVRLNLPAHLLITAKAASTLLSEFFYLFGVAGLAGFWLLVRYRSWWQLAALAWGCLATTSLLAYVRPYDPYNDLSFWIISVYPLPAYFFFAVGVGIAVAALVQRSQRSLASKFFLCSGVLVALLVWQYPRVERSDDDIALVSSQVMLADVPADGLALVSSNDFSFPNDYVNFMAPAELKRDLRKELTVLEELNYDGSMPLGEEKKLLALQRPVYFFFPVRFATSGLSFHGLHYSLAPEIEAGKLKLAISPASRELLERLVAMRFGNMPNQFTKIFIEKTLIEAASNLVRYSLIEGNQLSREDIALLASLLTTPEGQYGKFIIQVLEQPDMSIAKFEAALGEMLPYLDGLSQQWSASVQQIVATARLQQGDVEGARVLLEQALAEFPSADNARVLVDLLQLYAVQNDFASYARVRRFYPALDSGVALDATDAQCALALAVTSCAPLTIDP